MLPAIPDDSKKSKLRVKRNPINGEASFDETARNHISAISTVIASIAGIHQSIRKPKRTSSILPHVTSTIPAPSPSLTADFDTINTLKKHSAAIEKLKSSLTDRRNDWSSFEFSGLHTLEHGDSSNLRHEIEKVLNTK